MELQPIQQKIIQVRDSRTIPDVYLAELYQVEIETLRQAVKQHQERFPADFMFELSPEEVRQVFSQNVLSAEHYPDGKLPMVFTEQGVAMLSSVLPSQKAIEVHLAIIRSFVMLRGSAADHQELQEKVEALEARYDKKFEEVYRTLKYLVSPQSKREPVGFRIGEKS